jgi:putative ABC transport system permease protein
MNRLAQDLAYALRQLQRSPGFTAVAVLTLALGIGANTAIFTVVNALLLKMLPVRDPQQLVIVGNPTWANAVSNGTPSTENFSYPLYKELRDHNGVFSGLCAAASDHRIEVETGTGQAFDQKTSGRMVSGNYFDLLGLEPAAGRLIADADDIAENANPEVVLAYSYWQRKFGLSRAIIGKNIRLNGYVFTVIGVAPAGFEGDVVGERMSFFVPLSMQPAIVRGRHWRNAPNTSWLSLIGRLNSGITPVQAEANLNGVLQQALGGDYGASLSSDDRRAIREDHIKIQVSEGGTGISDLCGDYHTPLLLLMGIVGLVLLIACVNVTNLLLSRASMRHREFAVRFAIGANRTRVFRQLLTESILLALLGGIAGSLLAFWGVRFLVGMLGSNSALPVSPDARVLGFSLGISLLTGILFGMFPALRCMRVRISPALTHATRATRDRGSRPAWGKVLIAGQVALSLLVLFAASLLIRSLQKLMSQDFGYRRDHLIIAKLDPSADGYAAEKMKPLAQQLVSTLAGTPGINAVTYSTNGIFAGTESSDALLIPGFTASSVTDRAAKEDYVGPNYFEALGIPILSGRGIEDQDTATAARVAVVNEAMVKRFFHGENPIGHQFRIDDADWLDKPITIVGVSHNAKDHGTGLREEVEPRFYLAFQQMKDPIQIVIEAQVRQAPRAAVANVISQIKTVDPHMPVEFVQALESRVQETAANQIALAKLSAFFGSLALLLACVGLYGVMSYSVAGRTREIGVRMALGARRADVLQLVLREGMLLVGAGLAVGLPLSLASGQLLHSFLFGLKATDPLSLIVVVLLLGAVAGVAGMIPARRAAKVEPMTALRYE